MFMAKKPLTKQDINQRLKEVGKGIELTGDYGGLGKKTSFRCTSGHVFDAQPRSPLSGNGCPHCAGQSPLSKEIVNERIENRGIELVGEYINARTKTEFLCNNGHKWTTTPDSVCRGHGCPFCDNQARLSKEDLERRLVGRNIEVASDYLGSQKKTIFRCGCGWQWSNSPSKILSGRGCPVCANYGFNPDNPAWEYAFIRNDYIKYGITNDLSRRLNEHRKHGEINLVHERYREKGQLALDWENYIKKTHGGRHATKEQCPDGYTETLPIESLSKIICR